MNSAMLPYLRCKKHDVRSDRKFRIYCVVDRAAFLVPLIGELWAWQSRNCWDFRLSCATGIVVQAQGTAASVTAKRRQHTPLHLRG